jgi:predicted subunit of tRNA(5-methylaminomethyl-2-thiouridylate) methyltransferase
MCVGVIHEDAMENERWRVAVGMVADVARQVDRIPSVRKSGGYK